MISQSFLSSSSTLGEGLDVMSGHADELVESNFALDSEEQELRARLKAPGLNHAQL